jgi:hypothetical protein
MRFCRFVRNLEMVHWLLCGSEWNGGSRLQGINVHRYLRRSGIASQLTFVPPPPLTFSDIPWVPELAGDSFIFQPGDTAVIHTLRGPATVQLIQALKKRDVRTVFVDCDLFVNCEVGAAADEVVGISEFLAEKLGQLLQRAVHCIPDAVEDVLPPEELSAAVRNTSSRLRIGWVGIAEHWGTLDPIRRVLELREFNDFQLVTISNHPRATFPWTPRSRSTELRKCDLVVVPTRSTPQELAKSVNRVAQAMALGRPVAAGKIPAYMAVIQSGENGFLCDSPEEWADALGSLREPQLRRRFAQNAYELVGSRYTMHHVGMQWESLLRTASRGALESCPPDAAVRIRVDRQLQLDEWDHFAMQYRDRSRRGQSWKWGARAIGAALRGGQFHRAARLLRGICSPRRVPVVASRGVLAKDRCRESR